MCGICGFVNYRNEDLLKGMASRLAHRGPDEDGCLWNFIVYMVFSDIHTFLFYYNPQRV